MWASRWVHDRIRADSLVRRPFQSCASAPKTDARSAFRASFHIGREHDCDVRIEDGHVSRKHVMVSFEDGRWQLRDQQSGNGVFVDGRRVDTAAIDRSLTIRLGADGPTLVMDVESRPAPATQPVTQKTAGETVILASYAERYFGAATDEEPVGGRTLMIRKAFHKVQKKQRRLYRGIVAPGVCWRPWPRAATPTTAIDR